MAVASRVQAKRRVVNNRKRRQLRQGSHLFGCNALLLKNPLGVSRELLLDEVLEQWMRASRARVTVADVFDEQPQVHRVLDEVPDARFRRGDALVQPLLCGGTESCASDERVTFPVR
jgi:hypothetical protein